VSSPVWRRISPKAQRGRVAPARIKLAGIIASALLLASLGTHFLVGALGIQTKAASKKHFGNVNRRALALISGSSLTYDGVDWNQVADFLGLAIESWPVPGSSPAEWEQLQLRSPQAKTTFVGISLYDLNEAWLCDFRADLVPFHQTLADLWHSGSDLDSARRVWSCYPRAWVRPLFPTAGRSQRVIFGLRDTAVKLLGGSSVNLDSDTRLRLATDYTSEAKISDWPNDRLLRRLAAMRTAQGEPGFFGSKHAALRRLLQRARRQGAVVVVVLPVSPPYAAELLSEHDIQQFEASLADVRQSAPQASWVRLDKLPALHSADYFYDLVHLNMQGRGIATNAFLKALAGTFNGQ
jgi:hypothetical protein